jgi:hypothetical protein
MPSAALAEERLGIDLGWWVRGYVVVEDGGELAMRRHAARRPGLVGAVVILVDREW